MSKNIEDIVKKFKLNWALQNIDTDKDEHHVIYHLIEQMANDTNSSSMREDVTKWMIGKESSASKLGYDDDFEAIEVKPRNFTGNRRLDGGGKFSDFTWYRDEKYHLDKVQVVASGFSYGRLLFIVQFDYDTIRSRIQDQLTKYLPDGDVPSRYVRSASFSYLHWRDNFDIKFLNPNIDEYENHMVKGLYTALTS